MSEMLDHARTRHAAIRKALMERWDPIGVSAISEARNEYDHYIPTIHRLLISRCPKQELVDYLWWLETEHMGLSGDLQATENFAEFLQDLIERF